MKKYSLLLKGSLLILAFTPFTTVLAAHEDIPHKHKIEFSSAQDKLNIDENKGDNSYFQEAAGGSPFDPRH